MDISRFDNLYDNDVLMDVRIIEELLTNTTQVSHNNNNNDDDDDDLFFLYSLII